MSVVAWRAAVDLEPAHIMPSKEVERWQARVRGPIDYYDWASESGLVGARADLELLAKKTGGGWISQRGVVRASLRVRGPLARGDLIDVPLVLHPMPIPRNHADRTQRDIRRWYGVDARARGRGEVIFLKHEVGLAADIARLRFRILRSVQASQSEQVFVWVAALALGSRAAMDRELRETWGRAGVAHLLAISGLHMATLLLGVMMVLGFVVRRVRPLAERYSVPSICAVPAMVSIWLFCSLVGQPLSALRASLMGTVVLLSLITGHRSVGLNAMGLAGAIMALMEPRALGQPGWLLSFSATAALLLWLSGTRSQGFLAACMVAWKVSWIAWLGTSVWCVIFFGQVSWVGPWLNLIAVPWVSWIVLPLSIGVVALAGIGIEVPSKLAAFIEGNLEGVNYLVGKSLTFSWSDSLVHRPDVSHEFALLGFLILLGLSVKHRQGGLAILIGVTVAAVTSGATQGWGPASEGYLVIEQPYVGHGDGALMKLPGGEVVLIDAPGPNRTGGWDPGREILGKMLERRGVDTINLAVMTHPHWDHIGGFDYLSRRFQIEEVWVGGGWPPPESRLAEILERVKRKGGRVILAESLGQHIHRSGVDIEVVHPRHDTGGARDPNDDSVVLRLVHNRRSILFTGDISDRIEDERGSDWRETDIVKVAHHGSATSSSFDFIDRVRPRVAMVSCAAEQRVGVPSLEALRRYELSGARVLRTDLDGAISLWTNGERWRVRARQESDEPLELWLR